MITALLLAVFEDGEVLGPVDPLRIKAEEAIGKDEHLKAAFAEQHAYLGTKTVRVVALTGLAKISDDSWGSTARQATTCRSRCGE
jgi:hypothetical protein